MPYKFRSVHKKVPKWHYLALYDIFTNKEILKNMPFPPENGIKNAHLATMIMAVYPDFSTTKSARHFLKAQEKAPA